MDSVKLVDQFYIVFLGELPPVSKTSGGFTTVSSSVFNYGIFKRLTLPRKHIIEILLRIRHQLLYGVFAVFEGNGLL